MTEKRERPGWCGVVAPLGDAGPTSTASLTGGVCVRDPGHDGWHEDGPGARWVDPHPPYQPGLVVRPGDTLVLILSDEAHASVDADTVAGWVHDVRATLPEGADVLFLGGVTPVVIQGHGRCDATTTAGYPPKTKRCQRPHGHHGHHDAAWATGGVSW